MTDLQMHADNITNGIRLEFESSTNTLYTIASLFDILERVEPSVFKEFTTRAIKDKPGILLVEWQPRVKGSELGVFLKDLESLGIKNFTMVEPDSSGKLVPAKKKSEHFPVLYSVSKFDDLTSIGLDLAWSEERMASKYLARDSGLAAASNTFDIFLTSETGSEEHPGFAITIPIYKAEGMLDTVSKRQKTHRGFLAAVYYTEGLVGPIDKYLESNSLGIRMIDTATKTVVYQDSDIQNKAVAVTKNLEIYGQKWEIQILPDANFYGQYFFITDYLFPTSLLVFLFLLIYILNRNEKQNTRLAQVQVQLERALVASKAAAKSKMTFLANMSHEIRTPLNAIIGYARLLDVDVDNKDKKLYTTRMISNGELLQNTIDDILEISNFEEGKVRLDFHNFNLISMFEELKDIISLNRTNDKIEFKVEAEVENQLYHGDSYRIRQILINLLSNSLKFTSEGFIKLICSETSKYSNGLRFEIIDTGVGISPDYLERATTAFSQEDESFSRSRGGVGLGLYITRKLVEQLDGYFAIESEKGKGTTVVVELPLSLAVDEEDTDPREIASLQLGKKIIIAEDDADAQFIIKEYLKELNLELDFVSDGSQLIEKVLENDYDLVITDVQMPVLDGVEATRILRQKGVQIPIVVMSAHTLNEEKDKCFKAGVNSYISKPILKEELIKSIISILQA